MTLAKTCFKCLTEKPLEEFYRQPQMADGHVGKCKECTKAGVRANRAAKISQYTAYERGRNKLPHRVSARAAYQETEAFRSSHKAACRRWDARNPERKRAHGKVAKALRSGLLQREPCHCCGDQNVEAHHPDYSRPLEVVWLCPADHHRLHEEHELFLSSRQHFVVDSTVMNQNNFTLDAAAIQVAGNILQLNCHGASSAAGWWTNKDGTAVRDNPMAFSQKLMLTVSELAEAMEGDRKNLMDDHLPHRQMREVELADAVIRIYDLAGAYGLDLGGAIAEKLAYNQVRKDHKPEARAAAGGKTY